VSDDGNVAPFAFRLFAGVAFAAAGLFPILAAFDVGPFRASSINGPPWIGVAAGAIFITGGLFVWFQEAAVRRPWLGSALALAIVAGFAALANWIAFGPETRECSSTFSLAMFTSARWVAGLECRIAFGIGATMCNGLLLLIVGRGLLQAGVKSALPGILDRIGTWLILLAFAPLVLVYLAAKLVAEGARWCRSRVNGHPRVQG
jgi:hypothetical protein